MSNHGITLSTLWCVHCILLFLLLETALLPKEISRNQIRFNESELKSQLFSGKYQNHREFLQLVWPQLTGIGLEIVRMVNGILSERAIRLNLFWRVK